MTSIRLGTQEGIIFDLDSTLIETHDFPVRASEWLLRQVTDRHEEMLSSYLGALIRAYRQEIDNVVRGGDYIPPIEVIRRAIAAALHEVGLDAPIETVERGAKEIRDQHIRLADVTPAVRQLVRRLHTMGVRLAVLTNTFEGHASLVLGRLGLADLFMVVADTGDVKGYKPMRGVFETVLDQLGTHRESTVCVGDEYYADVVGATRAGMQAVWVNGRRHSLSKMLERYGDDTRPVLVVTSADDLLAHV